MNAGVIGAIALFIIVLVFWMVMTYKAFRTLHHSATEGFIAIEYYFGRRRNLVDDLTKLVKKQMSDDEEIVQNVVDANRLAKDAKSNLEKLQTEGALADTLETLFMAVEKYPELAESKRYTSLKEKIEDANDNILKAGKLYNSIARMMNQRVNQFPTKLIAKLFGFKEHPML